MENLQEQVQMHHAKGESPVAIRNRLLGREDRMYYLTAGHFSKTNLIASILSGTAAAAGQS
jgi:hypothetical protein